MVPGQELPTFLLFDILEGRPSYPRLRLVTPHVGVSVKIWAVTSRFLTVSKASQTVQSWMPSWLQSQTSCMKRHLPPRLPRVYRSCMSLLCLICAGHLPLMLRRLAAAHQVTHADLELGYIPAVERTAELVRTGALGKLQTVTMRLRASWQAEPQNDLSTIGRLAPWYVDVLNHIVGMTPLRVLVLDGHGNAGRAQNYSLAHFDYGEALGSFDVNIASVGELTVDLIGAW